MSGASPAWMRYVYALAMRLDFHPAPDQVGVTIAVGYWQGLELELSGADGDSHRRWQAVDRVLTVLGGIEKCILARPVMRERD